MRAFTISEKSAFKPWNGFKVSKNSAFKNPNIIIEIPFNKLIDLIEENILLFKDPVPRKYHEFIKWTERLRIISLNGNLTLIKI